MLPAMLPRFAPLVAAASLALAACSSASTDSTGPSSGRTSSSGASSGGAGTGGGDGGVGGMGGGDVALRVLFIGNSYTYVNDLPGRVHALAASSGIGTVEVDSVVQGGATLEAMTMTNAPDRIAEGGWTHVVLQGQSVEPLLSPASFEAGAKALSDDAKSAGAAIVFYETWARQAGDAIYAEPFSGGTPEAMQAGLRAEYQKVADINGGAVAPAGDAWEQALAKHPSINLFAADGSHPSVAGTYLVACVFHAKLTGHSPVGIPDPPPEVSPEDAAALQAVAAEATE